jgi:uncharacterized protein YkwD
LIQSRLFRLLCIAALSALPGCFAPTAPEMSAADAKRMADEVLELVNLARSQHDLHPVVVNPELTALAESYAQRMIQMKFFGHHDPVTGDGPAQRAVAARYAFIMIGENLAAGQQSAAEVMKAWMESQSHADIILDPAWREAGIAVAPGGERGIYWVQEFAAPVRF